MGDKQPIKYFEVQNARPHFQSSNDQRHSRHEGRVGRGKLDARKHRSGHTRSNLGVSVWYYAVHRNWPDTDLESAEEEMELWVGMAAQNTVDFETRGCNMWQVERNLRSGTVHK